MMMTLVCAVVGKRQSAFCIDIDPNKSVGDLKKAIKAKNEFIQYSPDRLDLFLATNDGKWLLSSSEDVEKLRQGERTPLIQTITRSNLKLVDKSAIAGCLANMETLKVNQLHVLVVLPWRIMFLQVGQEKYKSAVVDELTLYRQRGEAIQRNCKDYCQKILDKIDELYAVSQDYPVPFICVEGSSGMGKSQLAFALGGSRPWFYWPTSSKNFQLLYGSFSSISAAFHTVTTMYGRKHEASWWTYGFIRALLEYCNEEQNQHGRMIRFQEKMSLPVVKCKPRKVIDFREKMKADGKALPFFILDNKSGEKMNRLVFQRDVFRVCGLVVVVMGTDAIMNNLIGLSGGSDETPYAWMTIISRFPPYQSIPFADVDKQSAWDCLQARYPVISRIVMNSRGRFARLFIDEATDYAMKNSARNVKLCDLLDVAFFHVSLEAQVGERLVAHHKSKSFMGKQEGRVAQMMAISYTHVGMDDTSPPSVKRRGAGSGLGTYYMHKHFANLADQQATKVTAAHGSLLCNDVKWKPCCLFPTIEEDVLLYLAVLGGKDKSGYYDHCVGQDHSTFSIFSNYMKGREFGTEEYTNAESFGLKTYQNMISHMIFIASRRNGVQGIRLDDFFAGLLCEFNNYISPGAIEWKKHEFAVSYLLKKYPALEELSRTKIPFLAPPNAEWPQWILDTRVDGCNFGHIVRAQKAQRCDLYVCNVGDLSKPPLFLYECKYRYKSVDFYVMDTILCGLESVWKDNWALVLVFCVKLANIKTEWDRENVGCVKVDCHSHHVEWIFQPSKENRRKLVIAMETGSLATKDAISRYLRDPYSL